MKSDPKLVNPKEHIFGGHVEDLILFHGLKLWSNKYYGVFCRLSLNCSITLFKGKWCQNLMNYVLWAIFLTKILDVLNNQDQVLLSMQQKLDDLCDQVNPVKHQSGTNNDVALSKNVDLADSGVFGHDKINFVDCGCWLCDQHHHLFCGVEVKILILCCSFEKYELRFPYLITFVSVQQGSTATKPSCRAEMLQYKMPLMNEAEQEERRMSDLSDWASSVTSAADVQVSSNILVVLSASDFQMNSEYYNVLEIEH